jgi:acid phosphatase (class A)
MKISNVSLFGLVFALAGCASHPTPVPQVVADATTGMAMHPVPSQPTLIAADLLPEFKKGLALLPAAGSKLQKKDEAELRDRQAKRTAADCTRANSEVHVSLGAFFGAPNGPLSASEVEPLTDFFDQIRNDADFYIQLLKKEFARPRPFTYIQGIEPCVPKEVTGAYPSGHAALSTLYAKILSDLYPKRVAAFRARAAIIASDRILGGVHHPSDIRAGKALGEAIYKKLKASTKYQALFATHAAPKIELRLKHVAVIQTRDIAKADVTHEGDRWGVHVQLKPKAAKRFAAVTKANRGKALEVVIDGITVSAPLIQAEIVGGNIQLTDSFTEAEAKNLVSRFTNTRK